MENTEAREAILNNVAAEAVQAYEFNCSWGQTKQSIVEGLINNGISVNKPLVLHVLNLAKVKWQSLSQKTRAEICAK